MEIFIRVTLCVLIFLALLYSQLRPVLKKHSLCFHKEDYEPEEVENFEEDEDEEMEYVLPPSTKITVSTYDLQEHPQDVMALAEREGTVTIVDDDGEPRLLLSIFGDDNE